jgi:transposase
VAREKNGQQAIGHSRGGPTTKIHATVDALGNPVRLLLTQGQTHDIKQAPALVSGLRNANIIADKGYDSKALVDLIEGQGCTAVIPSRALCSERRSIDWHLYKERALVEGFFQKIKRNRRIAMRFEKLAIHFLAMVTMAAVLVWLA